MVTSVTFYFLSNLHLLIHYDETEGCTVLYFQLEQKQIPPPYKPRLNSDRDLANFPPEFTDEPVHLTPDDS